MRKIGNLIISRCEDEAINVRDTETGELLLKITVVRCKQNQIRLGLTAGKEITFIRSEIDSAGNDFVEPHDDRKAKQETKKVEVNT